MPWLSKILWLDSLKHVVTWLAWNLLAWLAWDLKVRLETYLWRTRMWLTPTTTRSRTAKKKRLKNPCPKRHRKLAIWVWSDHFKDIDHFEGLFKSDPFLDFFSNCYQIWSAYMTQMADVKLWEIWWGFFFFHHAWADNSGKGWWVS